MSSVITITRGLDLPIPGQPLQEIDPTVNVRSVALIGLDYLGLKPRMAVAVGDRVQIGQTLFTDKRDPAVHFTAPGGGVVTAVNRGAKRVLQSVVIELDADLDRSPELITPRDAAQLASVSRAELVDALCRTGLWVSLRTRPYSKIPASESTPDAIFITAMDSNPLCADADTVIAGDADAFRTGVRLMTRLTDGTVHVCHAAGNATASAAAATVFSSLAGEAADSRIRCTGFQGPHPSGNAGTHVHFLHPVGKSRQVWTIGYQDVIAIGKLFLTGRLDPTRIVALGGPVIDRPRLLRARLGAAVDDLVSGQFDDTREVRVISGSVLSGRAANNWASFLGRYHNQISVIAEGRQRQLFGWVDPRGRRFSLLNVFLSSLRRGRADYDFHTSANGSARAMVPIGNYERVMPLDILATPLLRALLVRDTDTAQKLGCLELDEEDLALCAYVCHGKYEFAPVLRANLEQIERDG